MNLTVIITTLVVVLLALELFEKLGFSVQSVLTVILMAFGVVFVACLEFGPDEEGE